MFEELDDLFDFFFRTFKPCDIFKGDLDVVFLVKERGFGFSDIEDLRTWTARSTGIHSAHDENPQTDHQQDREYPSQNFAPVILSRFVFDVDPVFFQLRIVLIELVQIAFKGFSRIVEDIVRTRIDALTNRASADFLVAAVVLQGIPIDEHLYVLLIDYAHAFHITVLHHFHELRRP
ncbi:MAG: Uncharacterised protein [Flavobacteriia bacterium]|nr:MAG: Uncharacterised protein [Flavobacteriia bacterium]